MDRLRVSELAGEAGTSPDTVRYYERIGLLAPPERSPSGYRLYDLHAVERVRFIKQAQRFGLRLADIADLIAIQEEGLCPCGGTRRLLEARMAELDEELAALSRLRQDIGAMLDDRRDGEKNGVPRCGPLCGSSGRGPDKRQPAVRTTVSISPTRDGQYQQRQGAS